MNSDTCKPSYNLMKITNTMLDASKDGHNPEVRISYKTISKDNCYIECLTKEMILLLMF